MENKLKKMIAKVELSMTEETLHDLMAYRDRRGFPSIDEAVSEIIASKLGKTSSPMWTDSEILAIPEGSRAVLGALCKKSMDPAEITQETGISEGKLRAFLAHLSRRYKKFQKEPLHIWNESIQKYEVNPKYIDMLSKLLT
jgi:hypothetical protein